LRLAVGLAFSGVLVVEAEEAFGVGALEVEPPKERSNIKKHSFSSRSIKS
jgi:hypothetical protein